MLVTARGANPNAHDVTGRTSFHAAIVTDAPSVFIYGCRIELIALQCAHPQRYNATHTGSKAEHQWYV